MIFLCFVHFNGVYQTFWVMYRVEPWPGTLQLHDVCKRICFWGFKYYHNPKHSGPNTAGRQGGGLIVLIICCRVGLCCDLRLHVVRLHICPDCLKIEGNGKQMMMMDNFWSQSGWRHDDGFAENIFTGVARLGVGGPAPLGKILAPPEKMYSIKKSETWPHLGFCFPPWPKILTTLLDILERSDVFDKEKITQSI